MYTKYRRKYTDGTTYTDGTPSSFDSVVKRFASKNLRRRIPFKAVEAVTTNIYPTFWIAYIYIYIYSPLRKFTQRALQLYLHEFMGGGRDPRCCS